MSERKQLHMTRETWQRAINAVWERMPIVPPLSSAPLKRYGAVNYAVEVVKAALRELDIDVVVD